MTVAARRIWREIIASKPVDWFDADQLLSLRVHCEHRVLLAELTRRLTVEDVGSREFRELAYSAKLIGATVDTTARRLRLTVQNTVERHHAKTMERGSTSSGDELIGGVRKLEAA